MEVTELSKRKPNNSEDSSNLRQQDLDIYDLTDTTGKVGTIKPGDCMKLLRNLKDLRNDFENVTIVFHNDVDGLSTAILTKKLLSEYGYVIDINDMRPITHLELETMEHDPSKLYFYVDIQPKSQLEDPNIFCIDHHMIYGRQFRFSDRMFIYSPENVEAEFPTTATLLVTYLLYVKNGGKSEFITFINDKEWAKDVIIRWLVLLCAVADNLWLLSKFSKILKLQEWIADYGIPERKILKISIVISIVLGRETNRLKDFKQIIERPLDTLNENLFDGILDLLSLEVDNLYKFARELDVEVRKFVSECNQEVEDELRRIEQEIATDEKTINDNLKAMPVHLKSGVNGEAIRKSVIEMLSTVGDKDKAKWKQIDFYGKEIERLQTKISNLNKRLKFFRDQKKLILPELIPGISLFIGKQSSEQVKGILSSLLFYFGQKNILIEESEHISVWGARGFDMEYLKNELTTLNFDKNILDYYRSIEDASKELPIPQTFKKSLNISKQVTFEERYIGGMGGRGKVIGGNIKGKVPLLFATLESSDLEKKLIDLLQHGELGKALKGLTEGHSLVPTSHAIRSKLKTHGWVVVQILSGALSGDILLGETGMILARLGRNSKEIDLPIQSVNK